MEITALKNATAIAGGFLSGCLTLWLMYKRLLPQNGRKWTFALLVLAVFWDTICVCVSTAGGFTNGIMYSGSQPPIFIVMAAAYFFIVAAFLLLYSMENIRENILLLLIGADISSLPTIIISAAEMMFGIKQDFISVSAAAELPRWFFVIAVYLLLQWALFWLLCRILDVIIGKRKLMGWLDAAVVVCSLISSFVLSPDFGDSMPGNYIGHINITVWLLLLIAGFCAELAVLTAIIASYHRQESRMEKYAVEAQSALMYQYAEESRGMRDELHKLRHDAQNQVLTLSMLLDEGETEKAEGLAKELSGAVSSLPRLDYCENALVNAVLVNKQSVCAAAGIETDFRCVLPENAGVPGRELVSVFANLLDNAIAACVRQPEGKERHIRLTAGLRSELLVVECENSAPEDEKRDLEGHAKPVGSHGWGLRILRDIAARCGGSFNIEDKGSAVDAVIMLKCVNNKTDEFS